MQIPELEKLVEKFSSKKFFTSLVGILLIFKIELPIEYLWIKIVGIATIAITEVVFQARLDTKEKNGNVDTKPD